MRIGPDAAPQGYTHLLCYNVKYGQTMPYTVTLTDQFYAKGFQTAVTGPTEAACTPAKKTLLYVSRSRVSRRTATSFVIRSTTHRKG